MFDLTIPGYFACMLYSKYVCINALELTNNTIKTELMKSNFRNYHQLVLYTCNIKIFLIITIYSYWYDWLYCMIMKYNNLKEKAFLVLQIFNKPQKFLISMWHSFPCLTCWKDIVTYIMSKPNKWQTFYHQKFYCI